MQYAVLNSHVQVMQVGQRDITQNVQTNEENTDDNVTNFSY